MTPGYRHSGLEELFRLASEARIDPKCESFIFVRHGETDGNKNRIFQTADQPLNARGLEQAEQASAALAGERVARIMSSTMKRAWTTAEIVGRPHGVVPAPHDGLRERWFGDLVGTPSANCDWRLAPPNGETLVEFVMRTRLGLTEALTGDGATVVVAHGGTLYVLAPCLGLELEELHYSNAMPLRIERCGARWAAKVLAGGAGSGNNIA